MIPTLDMVLPNLPLGAKLLYAHVTAGHELAPQRCTALLRWGYLSANGEQEDESLQWEVTQQEHSQLEAAPKTLFRLPADS